MGLELIVDNETDFKDGDDGGSGVGELIIRVAENGYILETCEIEMVFINKTSLLNTLKEML